MNNLIGISGKIGSGKDTVGEAIRFIWDIANTKEGHYLEVEDFIAEPSDVDSSNPYQIKKYADKLKDIVCLLIGCTREQLEDRDFKEKELGEEWWYWRIPKDEDFTVFQKQLIPYFKDKKFFEGEEHIKNCLVKLTPRKLLQLLGTDCGRDIIHTNIWVNALFADYKSNASYRFGIIDLGVKGSFNQIGDTVEDPDGFPKWIITDVRFPNEAQAIKDRSGIIIRVNRPINLRFPNLWKLYTSSNKFVNKAGKFLAWLSGHDKEMWEKLNHPSETALDDYEFDHVIDNNGSIEELVEKVKQLNLV